jgi:sortase A
LEASQPSPVEVGEATREDEGLWLTVPEMARVKDLPVLTGPASDEAALAESALRVAGTGLPWQEEANVYIAGHRIGFGGEKSHLVFYDLDALQEGDEVILADANGKRYVCIGSSGASSSAPPTTTSPNPCRARTS